MFFIPLASATRQHLHSLLSVDAFKFVDKSAQNKENRCSFLVSSGH